VLNPLWLPLASINTATWIIRFYISTPGKNSVAIIPRYDQGMSRNCSQPFGTEAAVWTGDPGTDRKMGCRNACFLILD